MQKMIAINTIYVQKGKGEQVTARFAKAKSVHTFEGFIRMEVLLNGDNEEHDEIKVCTTWEDRQFFDSWLHSRENAKTHDVKAPTVSSPILGNELKTFDVKVQHLPAETVETK
ncbi:antibiotic biosynthesis monooxygenase [Sporosarcina sp. P19]|uniref:antibiotic biosynthesis monooxygenase n=1 Tax=Sporosarcina sp. P19 TaxID=2048258 RepID=UPI001E2DCF8F|nr:antibiotic biosynthesis monooxygenase [Sporosarcina sp. P19]